ncbi:MAG TPA: M24 family metallopeptidase, partial [Opitutales bacterium]|nr:M24 family metallopeptidase [Opitutales bacterium]
TFLKGKASELQQSLVHAVGLAQKNAIRVAKAGMDAGVVHEAAADTFNSLGYSTGVKGGIPHGFIHSTGHGVGLGLHEPIRVAPAGGKLIAGNVVTIEPGLYYPGLGGVRIEDVVAITQTGTQRLSNYHYAWQIA